MLHCGLLGAKLGHSYSPQIHGMLGDYEYLLYEKAPEELEDFIRNGLWDGLNVTIPYKKTVLAYCDALSEAALNVGSVNTLVRRTDGSIFGDNTDVYGFAYLLQKNGIEPKGKKTLVFGSGGASVAVKAVLEQQGAFVTVISRSGENNYRNLELHNDTELIVNTTPVGMYPQNGISPADLINFPSCQAVLDIIYNPARTALVMQAEQLGICADTGLTMLVAQAVRSSELFTGSRIPEERISEIAGAMSYRMRNLVLVGMPGCGKTTVASILGERMGKKVLDLDEAFCMKYQMTPEECIRSIGEAGFRSMETEVIREAGKESGLVIATGGGCVTVAENYPLLHQNGLIIWIRRNLKDLPTGGRPLSQTGSLEQMYTVRSPLYRRFADLEIDNQGTAEETAEKLYDLIMRS